MGNKKKQTNEFDNYFDDDFEVVYEDLDDLGSYLSEDSSDNNDDYDDYDGYDGDTDYYDDYDDDDGDDYDDDYDDDDYNSNGRDSKKKKRNDKQDPDSKKSKKKKRCGLPNVGKPVANIAKTGINATKKLVGTILRAATLILIALIILTLLKAFLSNAGSYGKILLHWLHTWLSELCWSVMNCSTSSGLPAVHAPEADTTTVWIPDAGFCPLLSFTPVPIWPPCSVT